MKSFLIFSLWLCSFLMPNAFAFANFSENKQSNVHAAFEQRLLSRLQVVLDSIVGKDQYFVNLKLDVKKPKIKEQPLYFNKLGISSLLPSEEDIESLPLESWIESASLEISIADSLVQFDEVTAKNKLEAVIQSLGKFNYSLKLSRFTSMTSPQQNWWNKIPWTPVAIIFGGLMLCFAFFGIGNAISNLKLTVPPTEGVQSRFDFEDKKPAHVDTTQSSQENTEVGAQKWAFILSQEVSTAKAFINEIASSNDDKDVLVLDYVLKNSPLPELKKIIQELPKETAKKIYQLAVSVTEPYSKASADLHLQNRMHQFLLSQFIDHDQALKLIHDFSIEECIEQVKLQPDLLPIFVQHYSSVQMERIFSEIDPALLHQFFSKKAAQVDYKTVIKKARESVDNSRRKSLQLSESATLKVLLAASHIEESRELALFNAAIPELPVEEILHAGLENFPQFLIEELPLEIVRPVFMSYPMKERAQILLSFDQKKRAHFMNSMSSEGRVSEVLEAEIDEISSSPQRLKLIEKDSLRLKKDFSTRLRKYLKGSAEMKAQSKHVLESWIQRQKGTQHEKSAA